MTEVVYTRTIMKYAAKVYRKGNFTDIELLSRTKDDDE